MMLTCAQLEEAVPHTVEYAKGSPEKIGHSVSSDFNWLPLYQMVFFYVSSVFVHIFRLFYLFIFFAA